MKKIRVLHIAEIDNDKTKGTSVIIPQYINAQNDNENIDVAFFNCNEIEIDSIRQKNNIFNLDDNVEMKVIDDFKPDIVIFHEIYKPYYLKIYKYLIAKKIPYIIIPHGGMTKQAQRHKWIKKNVANFILFNKFFLNARYIQYLSEKEKNNTKFEKLSNYVLGNGMEKIPKENLYIKEKKNNSNFNLVYVGRYEYKIKGLDQLLEACKLIKNENITDIKINLYGTGNKKDINLMKEYIQNNKLSQIVKLNGPIYEDEKKHRILSNDAFIQVSRTEGQSLGIIEALCLGMPVILSEGTGYKSIIDSEKIGICTITNGEDIYNSIINLKNKKEKLVEFSKNAFKNAFDNYSWNGIVKLSIEKYSNIIKNK